MKPHISVIIPTYNRPAALAELLEALSLQSYKNFEAIIVNDCGEPVETVAALYPELRIKLLQTGANVRHVHARNLALDAADGEWILLCDDDDLLVPDHIERMVALSEGVDLVYSDAEIVEFGLTGDGLTRVPLSRRLFAYKYDPAGMRKFSTFVPSGTLYRKRVHEEIGLFDADVYHYWDWDFLLRVSDRFKVGRAAVAGVLYAFSSAGGNMSSDLDDMRAYLDRLCGKHGLGELPAKNFFLLLEEPGVKDREAESRIVWNGEPIVSRYANRLRRNDG